MIRITRLHTSYRQKAKHNLATTMQGCETTKLAHLPVYFYCFYFYGPVIASLLLRFCLACTALVRKQKISIIPNSMSLVVLASDFNRICDDSSQILRQALNIVKLLNQCTGIIKHRLWQKENLLSWLLAI